MKWRGAISLLDLTRLVASRLDTAASLLREWIADGCVFVETSDAAIAAKWGFERVE